MLKGNKKVKIKEFIKENKYAIITIFILGVLTYLIKLTTYSFSIDTEAMLNNSEIQILTWISIQRYGLAFFKNIYNLVIHNIVLTNILSFAFLYISVILTIYNINNVSKNKSRIANTILGAIIITSPIIVEQFNFTLQVLEISISLVLFNIAFILINKLIQNNKKIILIIPIIAFIVLAFACYQSFIPLYILFSIFLFILLYNQKKEMTPKECIKIISIFVIIFILSYLVYNLIGNSILKILNIERTNYLSEQINWGKESIITTMIKTIGSIGITIIPIIYPQLYNIGMLVCYSIFLIYIIKNIKHKKYLLAIVMFGLLVAPFILNIALGGYTVARSQITVTYAVAFIAYDIYTNCNKQKNKKAFIIFTSLIVMYQLCVSMMLFYTDYNSYKKQVNIANEIYKQINIEKPIIFVGNYEATGKNILLKGEAMGKTFFEWDKKTNIGSNNRIYGFFKAIGLEYKKPNDEEIVAEMQKEHEEKLIIEEQNYTIVNLKCLDK